MPPTPFVHTQLSAQEQRSSERLRLRELVAMRSSPYIRICLILFLCGLQISCDQKVERFFVVWLGNPEIAQKFVTDMRSDDGIHEIPSRVRFVEDGELMTVSYSPAYGDGIFEIKQLQEKCKFLVGKYESENLRKHARNALGNRSQMPKTEIYIHQEVREE